MIQLEQYLGLRQQFIRIELGQSDHSIHLFNSSLTCHDDKVVIGSVEVLALSLDGT